MHWGKLIQICVHVQGKDLEMGVYDDLTLAQLKTRVADQCKVPTELQLYRFNQKTLWHDDKTLGQYYHIKEGSKLTLKIYKKEKIEKLKQQHIFLKTVTKTYDRIEKEHKKSNHSPSILIEIKQYYNAKSLYELALKETVQWQDMEKWMYDKLKEFVDHYQKEGSHVFKTITINIGTEKIRKSIQKKRLSLKFTRNSNKQIKLRAESRLNSISSTNNVLMSTNKRSSIDISRSIPSADSSIHITGQIGPRARTNTMSASARDLSKSNSKSKSPHYTRNIHNTFHRFHKYEYRNALCCCCADNGYRVNTNMYYLIMMLLFLICSICSIFVLFQVNQTEQEYSNYLTRSTCYIYNSSYSKWTAYDKYDSNGNCHQKSKGELVVNHVFGDIEYPEPYYGNLTNGNMTTLYPDLRYFEHACFVSHDCNDIYLSEQKSMIENPYEQSVTNWKVLLIFLWICVTIIAFCVFCVFCGNYGQKHDHYETEWMGTPNDWKCEYFVGYYSKKYELKMDRKVTNRVTEMVWRYHNNINVSQSKSSAFI